MKLLVLSHAAVLDVNRAVFQALAGSGAAEVTMIVPTQWKGDLIRSLNFSKSTGDRSIRVIPLPVAFSGRGSLFFYKAALARALKGWKPDLIFLDEEPWSLATLQTFLSFPGVPIRIFTKENLPKRIPFPFSVLERWVYRHIAGAFAVSEEVEQLLRSKGYQGPVQQLYHSYDPTIFKPLVAAERARLREELGIPAGAVSIGYFGRLTAEKGVLDLARALKRIEGQPHWHFLGVGNGPVRDDLELALRQLPSEKYKLMPAIPHDQVGKTLGAIDLLVLPSRTTPRWKEQFGRILVEAMACGAAVAGSDSGEIPFLIKRSGGGVVFHEGDDEQLATSLSSLVADRSTLASYQSTGSSYVAQQLTHEAVARDLATKLSH